MQGLRSLLESLAGIRNADSFVVAKASDSRAESPILHG
jgi:hypothetical protein